MTEQVKHPGHYNRGSIEVIEALKAMPLEEYRGFLRGNALKYIYRLGDKDDEKTEGEKAKTYIDLLVGTYPTKTEEDREFSKAIDRYFDKTALTANKSIYEDYHA